VIGQLEGWGDEEFADRKRAWVVTTLTRQHGLERGQFFSRLGELVREEVAAFS
jgi:hypothetical protein